MGNQPGLGHISTLLFAKESTYSTAPGTATNKYEVESFRFSLNQSVAVDSNMNSSGSSPRGISQGLQFVTGSFRIRVGYEGFEEMWRFIMPTYTQALVGGETLVRDHTLKEPATALSSYSIDQSFGNIPTGKVTRFTGVYCTSAKPAFDSQGQLVMDITFAADDVLENTTPMGGTPSVTNLIQVMFHHLLRTTSNLNDGTGITPASIYLTDLALSIEYPHKADRKYLGSVWANSPVQSGPMRARFDLQDEWDANQYVVMAMQYNNTPAALKFLFQHPATIGNSSKRELEFIASSPTAAKYEPEIPGFGEIIQNYSHELAYNTSDASCLKVRCRTLGAALP